MLEIGMELKSNYGPTVYTVTSISDDGALLSFTQRGELRQFWANKHDIKAHTTPYTKLDKALE